MSQTLVETPIGGRASFADEREVDAFVDTLHRFERGELTADQWRSYRVARGAYAQRQELFNMLRVKLPQGLATAEQLRALAQVGAQYSRSFGHITSRQDLQFHFLRTADLEPAMRRLAAAGITTCGAGGNTVRNVVACPFAGASADEAFDVTPYAEAVTRHFLRHPLANALPRKFKIAFEGCAEDHVACAIHDLGLWARLRTENRISRRGFRVTVAGGTSSLPTSGSALYDFFPAEDILALAEALVRLFHARGDRLNKQKNRLKFLVRQMGFDVFRAALEEDLNAARAEGIAGSLRNLEAEQAPQAGTDAGEGTAPPTPEQIAAHVLSALPRGPGLPPAVAPVLDASEHLASFCKTNVRPQRQTGHCIVTACAPQGEITAAQLEVLADLSQAYGEGAVRFDPKGRVHLRYVRCDDVRALHAGLCAAGLGQSGAGGAADVASCPGAEACALAVTRSRDAARLIEQHLRARLGAAALAAPLPVSVSGCPHGCRLHHLAAIGLQGSARKLGTRSIPQYFIFVGGGVDSGGARFGKLLGKVTARRVPEAVERLVALYLAERAGAESAGAFFARAFDQAKAAIAPLEALGFADAREEDYVEPGAAEPFRPLIGENECAA